LVARPEKIVLPPVVEEFLEATNAGNLQDVLDVFAPDAIVNDQLQPWRGLAAIAEWARRDVIADQLRLHVVHGLEHYGHCVVLAHADGSFDKRGLPDPLEVHLYFTVAVGKIVQLIILRNRSGTSGFDALLAPSIVTDPMGVGPRRP